MDLPGWTASHVSNPVANHPCQDNPAWTRNSEKQGWWYRATFCGVCVRMKRRRIRGVAVCNLALGVRGGMLGLGRVVPSARVPLALLLGPWNARMGKIRPQPPTVIHCLLGVRM